jgi:hypothetical protein
LKNKKATFIKATKKKTEAENLVFAAMANGFPIETEKDQTEVGAEEETETDFAGEDNAANGEKSPEKSYVEMTTGN